MFDEVNAGHVRPPVRVHQDEVIVPPVLSVRAQTVRKSASLVLAEEAVHAGHLVVGRVQVELHHICLDCSPWPRAVLRVGHKA